MNDERAMMTAEGQKRVRADIEQLQAKLRKVAGQKADAASETANAWHDNAAYEVAQAEEQRLHQRIAELEDMLRRSSLIELDGMPASDRVRLGSRVAVQFDDGEVMELTIRGVGEVDLSAGVISASSPLARAIMGARPGDSRVYTTNSLHIGVTVTRILEREG